MSPRPSRYTTRRWRALGRVLLLGAALAGAAPRAQAQTSTSLTTSAPQSMLDFRPTLAGGSPPAQAAVVRAVDGSTRENLAITTVRYETLAGTAGVAGWAVATLDRTSTPAVLTIRPSLAGIPSTGGQYRVTYTLSATGATSTVLMAVITVPPAKPALVASGNSSQAANAVELQLTPDADPRTARAEGAFLVTTSDERRRVALALSALNHDIGTGGWLEATLDSSRTPAVLRLVARRRIQDSTATQPPIDLAPGFYRATMNLVSAEASNSPRLLQVSLTVPTATAPKGGTPSLLLSGGTISNGTNLSTRFVTQAGQRDPVPQLIRVINGNSGTTFMTGVLAGTVTYGSGQPAGWLEVRQHGTTQGATIALLPRLGTLPTGSYTASFPVRADNDAATHLVSVTFDVQDPTPVLSLGGTSTTDATVAVRAPRLGALPAPAVARVTNNAPAQSDREILQLVLGQVTYSSGASGWLDASLVDTAAVTHVVLRPNTTALPRGSYTATVPVSAPGAGNNPRTVTVSYVIDPATAPVLQLARDSVRIEADLATDATVQTVAVTNDGSGTLGGLALDAVAYAAGEPTGWLAATLSGTTAPATLTLGAAKGTLGGGTYSATLTVRAADGTLGSPRQVVVRMVVPPRAVLALDSTQVTMTVSAGTPDTAQRLIQVTNAGDAGSTLGGLSVQSISYGAGATGWLTAALSATTAPATLTLRASADTLSPGTYSAVVWLQSGLPGTMGTPRRLDVVMVVRTRPVLTLARQVVTLVADSGSAAAADSVLVGNAGTGTLGGLALGATRYAAGQPTGWLQAALSATTAPAELRLTTAPLALAPGSYTAIVPVTADAEGAAQELTVTLTVRDPQAAVQLSADSLTITVVTGGGARQATVEVSGASGRTIAGLGAQAEYEGAATGWLTTALAAAATPATLTLGASAGTLPQGVHVARVTVGNGTATSAVVTVRLEVLDLVRSGAALVDATRLDAPERARLDRLGNNDGSYDLGDYLAMRLRGGVDQ